MFRSHLYRPESHFLVKLPLWFLVFAVAKEAHLSNLQLVCFAAYANLMTSLCVRFFSPQLLC